ncbi:hypothetical protein I4U23_006121 [Adineta vaga]|nr:hypothetical protein I4U23_006121 [Adineta vaga]
MKTQFENIPNELFYEIQLYLNATDLFEAFSNLNSRFNSLLNAINNLHFEIDSTVAQQRLSTISFASRITNIRIPNDSDAVAIAPIFPHIRSIIFQRAIRLIPSTLSTLEYIKLDLSMMRPKHAIHLCSMIFSSDFPCLSSLYILHRKSSVVGHWKPLIASIRYHQSLTITEFIFDIRPTTEWKMLEQFLQSMPYLQRLNVRQLNTRTRWTLLEIAQTFRTMVSQLNHLFIRINSLDMNILFEDNEYNHSLYPLFVRVHSETRKSKKLCTTTIISSKLHL